MTRKKKTQTEIEYAVAEGGGVKLLERRVYKEEEEYIFYDIMISNTVIIKNCKVVEGKNGAFISTPSRKQGEKFYPQAYISEAVQTAVMKLIDDDNAWGTTEDTYLTFENQGKGDKDEGKSRRRGRSAQVSPANPVDDYPL